MRQTTKINIMRNGKKRERHINTQKRNTNNTKQGKRKRNKHKTKRKMGMTISAE